MDREPEVAILALTCAQLRMMIAMLDSVQSTMNRGSTALMDVLAVLAYVINVHEWLCSQLPLPADQVADATGGETPDIQADAPMLH